MLLVKDLSFAHSSDESINDINLYVREGELVGLIGPNGSGKSTLLKNIYRALKPDSGEVFLEEESIVQMSKKQVARKMGIVGQEHTVPFDFQTEEIVAMGRSPHKGLFESDNEEDKCIVQNALKQTSMEHKSKDIYQHLSGGEKQRVILARVLAQQTECLLLDEPTNHLDIKHQLQIFDLLRDSRITALAAIHDLNIAAMYCDRIYVMDSGKIIGHGTPEEVLTPEIIAAVFQVNAYVSKHPITNKVTISYLPKAYI